jgi:hypothetical protein
MNPHAGGAVLVLFVEEGAFAVRLEDAVDEVLCGNGCDVQVLGDFVVGQEAALETQLKDAPLLRRQQLHGCTRRLIRMGRMIRRRIRVVRMIRWIRHPAPLCQDRIIRLIRRTGLGKTIQQRLFEFGHGLRQVLGDSRDEFAGMAMDGNKSAINPFQHLAGRMSRINRLILLRRPGPQVIYIVLKLPGKARQFAPKLLHVLLLGAGA